MKLHEEFFQSVMKHREVLADYQKVYKLLIFRKIGQILGLTTNHLIFLVDTLTKYVTI